MSTLTIAIIVVFVLGYASIAMESLVKIDKAAIALLMFVFCWTLYMFDPAPFVQLMHAGNVSEWTGHVTGFVNKLIIDIGCNGLDLNFRVNVMNTFDLDLRRIIAHIGFFQ